MATIFDILAGNSLIVWGSADYGLLVEYNGSETFNVWSLEFDGAWRNTDIFMAGAQAQTAAQVQAYVAAHMAEVLGLDDDLDDGLDDDLDDDDYLPGYGIRH